MIRVVSPLRSCCLKVTGVRQWTYGCMRSVSFAGQACWVIILLLLSSVRPCRLNRPARNAKTLRDLREEVQRLLQRYALEDIDSWSPRLRCFVLEEPSLLNWVYNSRAPLLARDLWRERQYCFREPSCGINAVRVSEVDKAVLRRDWAWLSAHGVLYSGAAEVVDAAEEAARHAFEFEERGEVMKLLSVEKPVRRSRRGTRSAAAAARRQQQRKQAGAMRALGDCDLD